MGKEQKVKLSDKVYTKDFKITSMGYDPREVDSFIDTINIEISKLERDIEKLTNVNLTLQGENKTLTTDNRALQQKLLESSVVASTNQPNNVKYSDSLELINRISRLENLVLELSELIKNK